MPRGVKYQHTKIIATIGPSSFKRSVLRSLLQSGIDICRLNTAHGTLKEHKNLIKLIRSTARGLQKEVGILLDLPGPKLRLPALPEPVVLTRSHRVALSWGKTLSLKDSVILQVPKILAKVLKKNSVVAIDDGKILLKINKTSSTYASASVLSGGEITSHKGISVLGEDLPLASLTEQDLEALALGKEVDFVAVSFVKKGSDIERVRRKVKTICKGRKIKPAVIAKIETKSAVKNIEGIIKSADGIMIARGDLGLALEPEDLPLVQKDIIEKSRLVLKPVIVATQMLDSMTVNILPTRAEISDVANAVIDHTDAVMLSGETASGRWPKEAVRLMSKIAEKTEASKYDNLPLVKLRTRYSSYDAYVHLLASFIQKHKVRILVNEEGDESLTKLIAKHRLEALQIVPCKSMDEARQLSIIWGVVPVVNKDIKTFLLKEKIVKSREFVLHIGFHNKDKSYMRLERV